MGDVVEFGAVVAVIMGAVFAWRFGTVYLRRLERTPEPTHRLDELERRLEAPEAADGADTAATDERLFELDERVDFAERMLGQQRQRMDLPPIAEDPSRLPD